MRSNTEYTLKDNQPTRLSNAAGRRIECLSGMAWITAQGEYADVTLRAGEFYTIPNQGLLLVEAVGAGRIRVRAQTGLLQAVLERAGFALIRLGRSLQAGQHAYVDVPK